MNDEMKEKSDAPRKKTLSSGAKWGFGCAFGCLVVFTVVTFGGCWVLQKVGTKAVQMIEQKVAEYSADFQQRGFRMVESNTPITVEEPVAEKILFKASQVKIMADCSDDVAIFANEAEIQSKVSGTVYFRGQKILIGREAEIEGDLDVAAQAVVIKGRVMGQVNGVYQRLDDQSENDVSDMEPESVGRGNGPNPPRRK